MKNVKNEFDVASPQRSSHNAEDAGQGRGCLFGTAHAAKPAMPKLREITTLEENKGHKSD